MTTLEMYAYIAIGLGLTAFGAFLHFLLAAVRERGRINVTVTAMQQELIEEAQLNIAKLDQLAAMIPEMEEGGNVPVYLPHRMTLAALHQAMATGQLRLLPSAQLQRRWRLIAELGEGFNGFVDNTELIATICLLHPSGLTVTRYRLRQLAEEAKATKQSMEKILSEVASSEKNKKGDSDSPILGS